MRVNNQTSDPVEYEQNGGGDPLPKSGATLTQSGSLQPFSETPPFVPSGQPPYTVGFSAPGHKPATSCQFSNPNATVTLNDSWMITVSTGCD